MRPALRKPLRVAVLVPQLTIEGDEGAGASAAGPRLWIACIEGCQRHVGLAVHDAEATPRIERRGVRRLRELDDRGDAAGSA